MDERTLTALQGSIEKWRDIENGEGSDWGADNCPLCKLFEEAEDPNQHGPCAGGCFGCPVSTKVGSNGCTHTPYMQWAEATSHRFPRVAGTPILKALARAEREFLESLLPGATDDVSVQPPENANAK